MLRELVENLVTEMLDSHLEKFEDLSTEIEDLRRRLQMMIRIGYVLKVHDNNKLIKVKHGNLETPFIKWFAQSAGKVSHYRCPSVNEQVLLLNFGAGDTSSQSIALVGIDSVNFPFPCENKDQVITNYGDKCAEVWDLQKGTLTFKAKNKIILDTKLVHATEDIHADKNISDQVRTMSEDRNIFNVHDHNHGPNTSNPPNQNQ